ncbi:MAG: hypothetical protein AAGF25_13015 [Pseudomonadota bacterium]
MAYAEYVAGNGIFSYLFTSAEERKARREKMAEYKRKKRELDIMSNQELMDLGYCRRDLHDILYRHYFDV